MPFEHCVCCGLLPVTAPLMLSNRAHAGPPSMQACNLCRHADFGPPHSGHSPHLACAPCPAAGHTASWGKAYPELLTRCYDTAGARPGEDPQPSDKLGPINPARNET